MQLAARQVAWENTQLRDLLISKGISLEETDEFLRGRERKVVLASTNIVAGGALKPGSAAQAHEMKPTEALPIVNSIGQTCHEPLEQDISTEGGFESQVVAQIPVCEVEEGVPRLDSPTQKLMHEDSARAATASSPLHGDDSMFQMSCEIAANIISSIRGNGDREQARSQLGCKGREHCKVSNVKVLQVMEMD